MLVLGGVAGAGVTTLAPLLNFWASWCAECRREMPVLERLHRALGPRGLAVVDINVRAVGTRVWGGLAARAVIEVLGKLVPRPEAG